MQFCDSNREITQLQQEEKEEQQRSDINCMLMRIQSIALQVQ